ncbi:CHAT domain-containing tetratricopeptide repeat protein [Sorangium sp. So ce260]|uniref:CHAT domain-containing tetratricopeptide repeat protein n=1 Tax=Sorangium sp. So ce260 TaxID=3133291 RepID=UPI003F607CF7
MKYRGEAELGFTGGARFDTGFGGDWKSLMRTNDLSDDSGVSPGELSGKHPEGCPCGSGVPFSRCHGADADDVAGEAGSGTAAAAHPEAPRDDLASAQRLCAEALRLADHREIDAAVPLVERALALVESAHGPEHPAVAEVLNLLAGMFRNKGDLARTETLARRALAIKEKTLGAEHPEVAALLDNLAVLYTESKDHEKAVSLGRRAVAIKERALGPEAAAVGQSLAVLAGAVDAAGDHDQAEPLYRRALAIQERALGPEHLDLFPLLNNLAMLYDACGDHAKAELPYRRMLAIQVRELGPDHPDVAETLDNLTAASDMGGDHTTAERLLGRIVSLCESVFAPDHPHVADALDNLAVFYRTVENDAKAEPLYRRALAIREKAFGPGHGQVARSRRNLAQLARTARAANTGDAPVLGADGRTGVEGPGAQASEGALAGVQRLYGEVERLFDQGKLDAAVPLAERALALVQEVLGPEDLGVTRALSDLATLHMERREYVKAEPLFLRALTIRERALSPDHPDVAASLGSLGLMYASAGDHIKAVSMLRRALSVYESALGPEHPAVAGPLRILAALAARAGSPAVAEPLQQRAVGVLRAALGPEHPEVASSLRELSQLQDRARAATAEARGSGAAQPRGAAGAGAQSTGASDRALAEARRLFGEAERLHHDGQLDAAILLAERAVDLTAQAAGQDSYTLATALSNLSVLHETKSDYAAAEQILRRALAIEEKVLGPEHPELITSLHGLVELCEKRGDYAQAEQLCRRVVGIRTKALGPEHADVGHALHMLAYITKKNGDYAQAEPLYRRALAVRERALGPEHPDVAVTLNGLAVLHREKGDLPEAARLYGRALAIREEVLGPEHPEVANSLHNIAVLWLGMDDARAEELFQRAVAIWEKAPATQRTSLAHSLGGLAALYSKRGDHAKAKALCERALAIEEKALSPEHPNLAPLLNKLASFHRAEGDHAKAEQIHRRAVSLVENALGPEHPHVARVLDGLVDLYLSWGKPGEALRQLERATAIEDRNAAALLITGSDEQKQAYAATLMVSCHRAIALHVRSLPDDEHATRLALATILNRKGRVLDVMADSIAALRRRLTHGDQVLIERLRRVTTQYSALVLQGPGNEPLRFHRARLKRLDDDRREIEADIGRASAELKGELRPVAIEEVQAAILGRAALVELFRYCPSEGPREPRYVAYVLRGSGDISWADLGEAAPIEEVVERWRRALSSAAGAPPTARDLDAPDDPAPDHRPVAMELDRLVMQPIRRLLGPIRRILLSPDGALNLVPFGALVDEEGRYLVERYVVTYLASGRDLVGLGSSAPARLGPVVVAAPDYDAEPGAEPRGDRQSPPASDGEPPGGPADRADRADTLRFRPLRFAAEEGRAVARKLPGARLLTGAGATERAIKALTGPSVLHIATHGFFLPEGGRQPGASTASPLVRSGMALAGANRRRRRAEDGILTALELSQLDLSGTKLVVMSACETGIGEVQSGDGVYGLRRAVAMAGAETQVMSLWSVDDAATCELMEACYDGLLDGLGRGEALRKAQLAMLGRPERAHPYYWAGFILSGNDAPLD